MRPFLFLLGALCTAVPTKGRAEIAAATPAADQQEIALAQARGALLYAYDQAAWHGTDDALAKLGEDRKRLGGWIVDGPATAPELVFFDRSAVPQAVYTARFADGKLISSHVLAANEDHTLSPARQRLVRAQRAALDAFAAAEVKTCAAGRPNTVVLPPTTPDGPVLVYLLTPQPDLQTIPFGGHFRVEISADDTAHNLRAFTKACMNLPIDPPAGDVGLTMMVGHMLDPVPTEIHVFSSLVMHRPFLVGIVGKGEPVLWTVDGHTIALAKR